MIDARLPYLRAALVRTYGSPALFPRRLSERTRVRLIGGDTVSLRQYCRGLWYFDVVNQWSSPTRAARIRR